MQWSVEASETVYTVTLEKPVVRFVRNAAEGFQGWPVGQAEEVLDLLEKLARTSDGEIHDGEDAE